MCVCSVGRPLKEETIGRWPCMSVRQVCVSVFFMVLKPGIHPLQSTQMRNSLPCSACIHTYVAMHTGSVNAGQTEETQPPKEASTHSTTHKRKKRNSHSFPRPLSLQPIGLGSLQPIGLGSLEPIGLGSLQESSLSA